MATAVSSVFFFQAEDGIRGVAVTGVQTCALPICRAARRAPELVARTLELGHFPLQLERARHQFGEPGELLDQASPLLHRQPALTPQVRSEERRVGKGCRARGWRLRYTYKR